MDQSIVDMEAIKQIQGVMGCQFSNGQFQVIIGTQVSKVYDAMSGLINQKDQTEELETEKNNKITPKKIGGAILQALSSSIIPIIEVVSIGELFQKHLSDMPLEKTNTSQHSW